MSFLIWTSCNTDSSESVLFERISSQSSGIDFINSLSENDTFNIVEYLYFYNGGGVAVGDINNDGLSDIYLSSNQGPNKLYLNKGDFKFIDISDKAGVSGAGNWKTGVAVADVNGDGYLDIFSCGVGGYKKFTGENKLYINNGDLTFSDKTLDFGLNFQGFSTHASFFDFDNDGDLDMYLVNHSVHSVRSYGDILLRQQSDAYAGDKLYRNDLIPEGISKFTEVTSRSGIHNSQIGYGLSVGISDLDNNGYLDIYVSNDFHENDYLYLNNGNGTFRQELEKCIPHTSRFSMGNDIADINNDGWQDIITLDMLPAHESIIKTTGGEDPFDIFQYKLRFGYHYQVARNTLQLNRQFSSSRILFSDIALLAGVEATDWSWGPLLADFDNDGFRDLFIANGILKRPNDLDYINYISTDSAQRFVSALQMVEKMPGGSVPNYFFKNEGDLKFTNVSEHWFDNLPSFSNGAAYSDLDNDGDLDLIVNNLNAETSIYKNSLNNKSCYLKVKLKGTSANTFGIGAKVIVYVDSLQITEEHIPIKGWQSNSDYLLHFGLGKDCQVDSMHVIWPGGKFQLLKLINANQLVEVDQSGSSGNWYSRKKLNKPLLSKVNCIDFDHNEDSFTGFESERLIPHSISSQGPKLAIADINADGLEDVFIGGAKGQGGSLFIQSRSNKFIEDIQPELKADTVFDITAAAFFHADSDGLLDLIIVGSGNNVNQDSSEFTPHLYVNSGKGKFIKACNSSLENFIVNASCVRPFDFDNDGDIDLFIGGRLVTGKYGLSPKSYLLSNDGNGKFTDVSVLLPSNRPGMITDALWYDVNSDNMVDLLIVGEWMPITLLQQEKERFVDNTNSFNLSNTTGWWNTILASDLDNDGDQDFLVGNNGLNSRLRPTLKEPVELWIGDIDMNGSNDPIITYYNNHIRYPFISKDQLIRQVPSMKKNFLMYNDFKNVTIENLIPSSRTNEFIHKKVEMFSSIWIENRSGKGFIVHQLPMENQMFPVYSFLVEDVNKDGYKDILSVGNLSLIQPELGRQDNGYGQVLLGNGKGNFASLTLAQSGFEVLGEGRDIKLINGKNDNSFIMVSRNNNSVLTFKLQ